MFSENKYTDWYWALVRKARGERRVRTRSWQYQEHHAVPSSLGGSDAKDNLVLLTSREHYLCHLLLTRMTVGVSRSKMVFAFFRFRPKDTDINSSKRYERHLSFLASTLSSEGNPFFGKKHSPETRARIVANHGMRGRTAYDIWVEEYGLEEALRMKTELKVRRSGAMSGSGNGMYGKVHPPEWRERHSQAMSGANNPNFGKSFVWMNLQGRTKKVPLSDFDRLLSEGWVKGRAGSGSPFGRVCKEETKERRRVTRLARSTVPP